MPKSFRDFIKQLDEAKENFNLDINRIEKNEDNVKLAKDTLAKLANDTEYLDKIKKQSAKARGAILKQEALKDEKLKKYLLSLGIISRIARVAKKNQTAIKSSLSQDEALKLLQDLKIEDLKPGEKSNDTSIKTGNGFINKLKRKEEPASPKNIKKEKPTEDKPEEKNTEEPKKKTPVKTAPIEPEKPEEKPEDDEGKENSGEEDKTNYNQFGVRAKGTTPEEIAREMEEMQNQADDFFEEMRKNPKTKNMHAVDWAQQYMRRNVDNNIAKARKWQRKSKYYPEKAMQNARKAFNQARTTIAIMKNNAKRKQLKGKVERGIEKIKEFGTSIKDKTLKIANAPIVREIRDTTKAVFGSFSEALRGKIKEVKDYAIKKGLEMDAQDNIELIATFISPEAARKYVDKPDETVLAKAKEIAKKKRKEIEKAKAIKKANKQISKIENKTSANAEAAKKKARIKLNSKFIKGSYIQPKEKPSMNKPGNNDNASKAANQ